LLKGSFYRVFHITKKREKSEKENRGKNRKRKKKGKIKSELGLVQSKLDLGEPQSLL
jgi:hypothetical protein